MKWREPAKACFVILSFISVFIIINKPASALTQDLTVSPTAFYLDIKPGGQYSGSFNIINQGDKSYDFKTYVDPYSVTGEDYTPDFNVISTGPNASNWVTLSTNQSKIVPSQIIKISYTIHIPTNVLAGGYYAVAFAETNNPAATEGVTINERVGALFYIEVAGNVVNKGSVLTWQSKFLQKPPLTSEFRIQDSGSVHFVANFQYKISDIFGGAKYVVNGQKTLLPQTIRRFTFIWPKTPSIGLFKISGSISYLNHTYKLGTKYVLVLSNSARIYTLIIIIILIMALITYRVIKHKKKKVHRHYS
jgi:hypothetical protein